MASIRRSTAVAFALLLVGILWQAGCGQRTKEASKAAPADSWLAGSTDEKLEQLARHHRGFDMAMVETGYRYNELWFAGQEANWRYAKYLADKIKLAIQNGYERRPKRKNNSEALFLNTAFKEMLDVIEKEDSGRFEATFHKVTDSCNQCHKTEEVAFIKVVPPKQRFTPLGP